MRKRGSSAIITETVATGHNPRLDGVRALAVLLVLALHVPKVPDNAAEELLAKLAAAAGQVGVDLFFVLSGYLITGILLQGRERPFFLRNFYARRTLRIFPLYYATLAAMALVLPAAGYVTFRPASDQLWFWTYLQDVAFTFVPGVTGPNHFWSLAVEEHFYLIWPFLVWKLDSLALRRVLWWTVALTPVVRALLLAMDVGTFTFTLARFDGLALGSLVALGLRRTPVHRYAWALVAPFAAAYFALSGKALWSVQVFKSTAIALLLTAVLMSVLAAGPDSWMVRLLSSALLRSIGKYSYAMYVFHPVLIWIADVPWHSFLIRFPLSVALTWMMARVSWTVLEYPFLRLKSRFA